jgi:hypothetical protein
MRFSPAKAEAFRYQCTEKGCRIPRGSFEHWYGPQIGYDHEELYFVTQTKYGLVYHAPNSLNPAARGIRPLRHL